MKSLIQVLTLASSHLEQQGISNPRREAEEMLSFALKIPRLQLYLQHDKPLTEEELQRCREAIARRARREPSAYIMGSVPFFHCTIQVTPAVLIPRQETEILASLISKEVEGGKVFWDVCCGSGCLGIAIKKQCPDLRVVLSDISPEALKVAQENASLNGVEVEIREGDLLAPFASEKADYVVCNPPYVSEDEYKILEKEVLCEPRSALVAANKGYAFYERLAQELPAHLNPRAKVWLEIGNTQGMGVKKLFSNEPWKGGTVSKDWAGQDRFFSLEFE